MNSALPRVPATTLTRKGAVFLATACVACLSACGGIGSSGSTGKAHVVAGFPVGVADPRASATANVTFTPATVVVGLQTVEQDLVNVSPDGSTFTFSSDSGPLGQLGPGKVMLLYGVDVARVTSVAHRGGDLVVQTVPVALADLVKSGSIRVSAPPDSVGGFGVQSGGTSPATASAYEAHGMSPDGPPVVLDGFDTGPTTTETTVPEPPNPGVHFSGNVPFGSEGLAYNLDMVELPNGAGISGNVCFGHGSPDSPSTCSNGAPDQVLSGQLTGTITWSKISMKFWLAKAGHLVPTSNGYLSFDDLRGDLKFEYVISRGTGTGSSARPPTFKLPLVFTFPICPSSCDGVPLLGKIEAALKITLATPTKNTVMEGGYELHFAGSPGISLIDDEVYTSGSDFKVTGSVIPPRQPSIALGSSAATIAIQVKEGVGLGWSSANVLAYVSLIGAIGEVVGAAAAGQLCTRWSLKSFITGSVEAQLAIPDTPFFFKFFSENLPNLPIKLKKVLAAKVLYQWPLTPLEFNQGNCYVGLMP
jgi:hypothetical protein